MLIQISVLSGHSDEVYTFLLRPCLATDVKQLKLDPENFYHGSIREFPHYETEILAPLFPPEKMGKLNYHLSEQYLDPYVCYPARIADLKELETILKVWAVGQIIILEFDQSLNDLLKESGGVENFLAWAKENRRVEVTSYRVNGS